VSNLTVASLAGFIVSLIFWQVFPLISSTHEWEWRLIFPIATFICLSILLVKFVLAIVEAVV